MFVCHCEFCSANNFRSYSRYRSLSLVENVICHSNPTTRQWKSQNELISENSCSLITILRRPFLWYKSMFTKSATNRSAYVGLQTNTSNTLQAVVWRYAPRWLMATIIGWSYVGGEGIGCSLQCKILVYNKVVSCSELRPLMLTPVKTTQLVVSLYTGRYCTVYIEQVTVL